MWITSGFANLKNDRISKREAVMALAAESRENFSILSDLEVVYVPTGAVFQAYPYSNANDMLQSVRVNWGRAGAPPEAEQVKRIASQLLLERAHRAISDRQLGNAA
jgi:hypothetical protein